MPADGDRVLAAEQEYLDQARELLRLMREDVLALPALAGDWVSREYLRSGLARRAQELADLPDAPLFFGRIDYAAGTVPGAASPAGEQFHIGRRHVHDRAGQPVVIDWRAPVARPFYQATPAEPAGVARRRRFGFAGGRLTAYEDEDLLAAGPGPAPGGPAGAGLSRIVIEEIERPRSGPMRDIVATIQPDQDAIVREDAGRTVCVQGAPGTGKTAVGLHRVAYLLYAHRERMTRGGVIVIGPGREFLGYIRDVLPALGEFDVTQVSVDDLVARVPVRAEDPPAVARVKGDARMAEVLRRALWGQVAEPADGVVITRGSRRWRIPAAEIGRLVAGLRERGVRYAAGRDMLSHRIAHVTLTRMEAAGETCDDRTHEAVRRSGAVRAAVQEIWPKTDPVRLVFRLLAEPDLLARAAAGLLSPDEQALISWSAPARGPGSARWSAADAVLIDEASDLISRTPSMAHVVLDEAQDLSPMQCRAVGRRCSTGSATILGDLAQGTTPWAADSWPGLLRHLGKPEASLRVLEAGYRVPRQILDFAGRLLGEIAPGLPPARSLRQHPGALEVRKVEAAALAAAVAAAAARLSERPGSSAVIAAEADIAAICRALQRSGVRYGVAGSAAAFGTLLVLPAGLAKGLEFDYVVVADPARIAAAQPRGLSRLYVALTRAVSELTVVHSEPLPGALAG